MKKVFFKLSAILSIVSLLSLTINFANLITQAAIVSDLNQGNTDENVNKEETNNGLLEVQIQNDISQIEYNASLQDKDYIGNDFISPKWHFANRANNIRSYIDENGWEMMPRTFSTQDDMWSFKYQSTSLGRDDNNQEYFQTPSFDSITAKNNQITSQISQNTTEWYKNTAQGIEHGFTIQNKPQGQGELKITGDLSTDLQISRYNDGYIFKKDNKDIFTYSNIKAYDEHNTPLQAKMEFVQTNANTYQLNLIINDTNAIYPIIIDPLADTPGWTGESNQASAYFGGSVSNAGDVNNDGYGDVIVGAEYYDNGQSNEGGAFVYHGSASGLALTASWTAESNQASSGFSRGAVSTAGDVNNDGYDDVIIGARYYANGQFDEGKVFVWYGSASGLGASGTPDNADWAVETNQQYGELGSSVSTAGDVNNDGYDDVIIGEIGYANGQLDEGAAFVYYGSALGLSASADWTSEGNQINDGFGVSVSNAGDVNGDTYDDVIVGAMYYDNGQTDEGAAFVWHGSASGLGASGTPVNADWSAESNQAGAYFGISVSNAGSVNGDVYGDVAVGADLYTNNHNEEGKVYVYHGSALGLSASANWTMEGNKEYTEFGISISSAGDLNNDGYDDLIVGSDRYPDNAYLPKGASFIYLGSASGLSAYANWTDEGHDEYNYFGISVSGAGDVNNDGYDDVIIGEYYYDNGQTNEGAAFVYLGRAVVGSSPTVSYFSPIDNATGVAISSNLEINFSEPVYAQTGNIYLYKTTGNVLIQSFNVATAITGSGTAQITINPTSNFDDETYYYVLIDSTAFDDLDGNSYTGIAVPTTWNFQSNDTPDWTGEGNQADSDYGESVSNAGDVNGDGYDDIIVGAKGYDNGQSNEGAARVYYGSASGPSASADWTAESNLAGALFGGHVSNAGDVNGDGYDDIIVGARFYNNGEIGEGWAFVWYGSASGLGDSGTPLNADWTAQGDQEWANLSFSISGAGDVNGDNYDDVIIGADGYDNGESNEGKAFVWYGSASGLGDNGTPLNADWTAESNQASANLGKSVSTAGDINSDGYDDIIVGSTGYDNPETYEGMAFVWHGSASGLGSNGTPLNADWYGETNATYDSFGYSVSTAGDVNNDGYDDVIIGAYGYSGDLGGAFAWYGSASGLGANGIPGNADWTVLGDQASVLLGESVSNAGDVNNDGYGDVIIGVELYDNPLEDEGKAWIYTGSATGLNTSVYWTTDSNQEYAGFGLPVSTAGDVDNDGYDDVISGAWNYTNDQSYEGGAFVYLFEPSGGDSVPPTVSSFSPADNATGVTISSNLVINFSESVDAETGNINLYKKTGDALVQSFNVTSDITGTGTAQITINPTANLVYDTEYYVLISATAFDDAASNSYTGIANKTTWNFTAESAPADSDPPTVSSLSPLDDATDVSISSNLVINFSEIVDAETGNINLYKTTGDVLVQAFNVTTDITGTGTTQITINPTADLSYETAYYVLIDATAFDDTSSNSYTGIAVSTAWNFTTSDTPDCPTVSHAATYNAYPTCGVATCESGYNLSGGACVAQSGGVVPLPPPSSGSGSSEITIPMDEEKSIGDVTPGGTDVVAYIGSIIDFNVISCKTGVKQSYSIEITDLNTKNKKIEIKIQPGSKIYKFNLGESQNIDLDNDKIDDINVTYNDLLVNRIDLTIKSFVCTGQEAEYSSIEAPKCPFTQNDGIIINFTNNIRLVSGYSDAWVNWAHYLDVASTISAGTYTVKTFTWDGYSTRVWATNTWGPQLNEQWNIEAYNGNTLLGKVGPTTDLNDYVNEASAIDIFTNGLVITQNANKVRAVHALLTNDGTANSVVPICASFKKQEAVPEEPGVPVEEPAQPPTPPDESLLCPFVVSHLKCPFVATRDLIEGMSGEDVKALQEYLNNNGFPIATSGPGSKGKETTSFGKLTKQALSKFQKAKNIKAKPGDFDLPTRLYLGCATQTVGYLFARDLGYGYTGYDVQELQKYLNTNDFSLIDKGPGSKTKETTFFGKLTQKAVAKLQKVKNIIPSLGYFGPKTREYVNNQQLTKGQPTYKSLDCPGQEKPEAPVEEPAQPPITPGDETTSEEPKTPPEPEDLVCPFTQDDGTVITFDFVRLVSGNPNNWGGSDNNIANYTDIASSITSGTYTVKTFTWDGYSTRVWATNTWGPQLNEQWNIEAYNGSTLLGKVGPTTDLNDYVNEASAIDIFTNGLVITQNANKVRAVHALLTNDGTANSVVPICASFKKQEAVPEEPQKETPAPAEEPTPGEEPSKKPETPSEEPAVPAKEEDQTLPQDQAPVGEQTPSEEEPSIEPSEQPPSDSSGPSLSPGDGEEDVPVGPGIVITFPEPVIPGEGVIAIYETKANVLVEEFDVQTDIAGSGTNEITINPSKLDYGTEYYVLIDPTAFVYEGGESFEGITNPTTWNFITKDKTPFNCCCCCCLRNQNIPIANHDIYFVRLIKLVLSKLNQFKYIIPCFGYNKPIDREFIDDWFR